jgi:ADP-dependent NAD(P)H-hydrate dehydratase / NAD(P)H-hydrate epimerase
VRRLVTAAEMRAMDREAIEGRGIPGWDLMSAAGKGVAEAIHRFDPDLEDAPILVLAGPGNNGGDGFVTARHLLRAEARPTVLLTGAKAEDLKDDAARAYREWTQAGGKTLIAPDFPTLERVWRELEKPDLIVDAMLGTGSQGTPRDVMAAVIEAISPLDVPVVAIDLPTGVDADTGQVGDHAVNADLTVTLALPKRGHFLYPGRANVGNLDTVDIGIPDEVLEMGDGTRIEVLEPQDAIAFLPERNPEMHKGDRGRLMVVGGSPGLTGAVAMACEAAVRAGAGLVTAGVPLGLNDVLEVKLTEAMTLPLPQLESRVLSRDAFESIAIFQPGRLAALAVGPGMGRHQSTQALVRRLIQEIALPTVLDADGLYAFSGRSDLLRLAAAGRNLVLTPHPGEFAMLTGETPEDIRDHRFELASKWAQRWNVVVVLKGAPTVIANPETGTVYVNPTGSEALATGGTGDVLTGLLAGFLAQGVGSLYAAMTAVYLHGWTADYTTEKWGTHYGLQASDVIDHFPLALGALLSPQQNRED